MFNMVISFDKYNMNPFFDAVDPEDRNLFLNEKTSDRIINELFGKNKLKNAEKEAKIRICASRFSELEMFDPDDIYYFESYGNLKCISTCNGTFEFYGTMKKIEKVVVKLGFLRIQKSYIISLKHIKKAGARSVQMEDGKTISVGRNYMKGYRAAVRDIISDSCLN